MGHPEDRQSTVVLLRSREIFFYLKMNGNMLRSRIQNLLGFLRSYVRLQGNFTLTEKTVLEIPVHAGEI